MTPLVKVGTFTKPVAAGYQTIIEPGFQPKTLILWTVGATVAGVFQTTFRASMGFVTETSEQYAVSGASVNGSGGVAPGSAARRISATAITIIDHDGTILDVAILNTWTGSGFRLQWTICSATARLIHYIALGGVDLTAKVIAWTRPVIGDPLQKSITGIGFTPAVCLHTRIGWHTGVPYGDTAYGSTMSLGAMDADGNEVCTGFMADGGFFSTIGKRGQLTAGETSFAQYNVNYTQQAVKFISMDADGFTTEVVLPTSANPYDIVTLCLGGISAKVGSFIKPIGAAPQIQPISIGWEPELAMFWGWQRPMNAASQSHAALGWGAVAESDQVATALTHEVAAVSDVDMLSLTDRAIVIVNNFVQTLDAQASAVLGTDGPVLTWDVNHAEATEILYLALRGFDPPPPPPPPTPIVPCIVPPELMGRYQVILYDHDGIQLALFDDAGGFENLEYIKSVNGQGHHNYGNFRLRVLATHCSEFVLDRFVQIRRKYPDGEWYTDFEGFHRRHEFLVDNADKEIYLSLGPDLKSIVKRRIIRPDVASAFFSRTDAFTDIMRELARWQLGSSAIDGARQFANFAVEADTNQGASVTRNLRGVGVSDELEILSELGADFDVDRTGAVLTFHVHYPRLGLDRRVGNVDGNVPTIFSLQRGNMVNPRIVTDRIAETTMAYVAGDGIGVGREIVERFSLYDAQFDSPWNRIEAFLEGSQNINTAALNALGDAFLMENKEMFTFEFQGIPTEGTQYGRDWNVGDLVTGRYREIDYNIKVVETHVILGDTGEEIRPTFLFIPEDLL